MFVCIGVVAGLMFLCTLCAWIKARYLTHTAKGAEHLSKAEAEHKFIETVGGVMKLLRSVREEVELETGIQQSSKSLMMVSPTSMPSAANLVEELVEELGAELKQSQSPSPEAEPPTELPASARASVQPALPADTSAANVEQLEKLASTPASTPNNASDGVSNSVSHSPSYTPSSKVPSRSELKATSCQELAVQPRQPERETANVQHAPIRLAPSGGEAKAAEQASVHPRVPAEEERPKRSSSSTDKRRHRNRERSEERSSKREWRAERKPAKQQPEAGSMTPVAENTPVTQNLVERPQRSDPDAERGRPDSKEKRKGKRREHDRDRSRTSAMGSSVASRDVSERL